MFGDNDKMVYYLGLLLLLFAFDNISYGKRWQELLKRKNQLVEYIG
jgi:hypothetical protein